ncbi:MAG: hypothetical protein V4640_14740 [Verrucomicrobiota bacterium]
MNLIPNLIACGTCRETMVAGGGEAASWSIFFLLAVILAVLAGVVCFMICLARREKQNLDPSLSDDYVPADSLS